MQDDANNVPRGTTLRAGVCIVGAGAAGITLARELAGGPNDVVLLESGGFEFSDATQHLCDGPTSGLPYALDTTRLRFFGGSTNHWAGQSRPLDAADFAARAWVPNSGWALSLEELTPFYERAQPMCDLGPFRYDPSYWFDDRGVTALFDDNETIRTAIFQIGGGTRFGTKYRKSVVKAPNVKLLLHANVVNVRTAGSRVTGVDVRTLDGNEFAVDAPVVVLASGGIENARLLLASRDASPTGVGNEHDLVGRYFMDHSLVPVGRLVLADRAPDPQAYFFVGVQFADLGIPDKKGGPVRTLLATLALTPAAVEAAGIPAFAAQLYVPGPKLGGTIEDRDVVGLTRDVEGRSARHGPKEITVFGGETYKVTNRFEMLVNMEPTPSPDSRVTLTDERDALDMPRAHLHWAFAADDWHSMETGVELLGRELGRLGLGRVHRSPAQGLDVQYGNHHMGTTRMHSDPAQGVVDANCEVHGVAGLYLAGSSVFPTASFSNPTLTIVALALRMAKRIDTMLAA